MTLIPGETQPGFTELFAQLGLPNDEASIAQFIRQHMPLADDVLLHEAPFWSPQQAQLLKEEIRLDDDWAIVVDQLNAALRSKPRLEKI
ncbi:MAG: DUF2789 domain-containing protein [Comamonas sp.]|jgi:hypothetical protein|nr:DUF2789 domain-containing protein [uncultured Comamonas sp.]MBP7646564.1 DUF2789 domain-containing protein [Comamonas sp.]MBP9940226.1 DUF2789 domain-containing protein [Comamonas sp.]